MEKILDFLTEENMIYNKVDNKKVLNECIKYKFNNIYITLPTIYVIEIYTFTNNNYYLLFTINDKNILNEWHELSFNSLKNTIKEIYNKIGNIK